jgi:serine protease Do
MVSFWKKFFIINFIGEELKVFLKIFLPISLLIIISLLPGCQQSGENRTSTDDSLFLKSANAQTVSDSIVHRNEAVSNSRQNAITNAAAAASPAVVGINVIEIVKVTQRSPFYMADPYWQQLFPELFKDRVYEQKLQSLGSGFIISPEGYIVTNDHVVGDGTEIVVTLPGGEKHNAELVGKDKVSDISLLKITGKKFPYLQTGNSDDLIVGEWAIALGNPFGLFQLNDQPTVTVGVISAINRDWGRVPDGRIYMDMIQTDAAINHGNSGGPLVNALGQVIGMNTFIYTGSRYEEGSVGIGFAIPINRILMIIDQIKQKGGVNRNYWLGFKVQDLNPVITKALGLKTKEGVIITQVDSGSSAAKAGLATEDIIVKVNGHRVTDSESLISILTDTDLQVGDMLELLILRDKAEKTVSMKLLEGKSQK